MQEVSAPSGHLTKTDWAVETIRREILRADLAPGDSLQQDEIARRLGISSTPVREAFAILEAQGLVERRPHRGVVVAFRDSSELSDVYELRAFVEPQAFRRATKRFGPDMITELRASIEEAELYLAGGDLQACRRANSRFHDVIIRASGSGVFSEVARLMVQRSLFVIPVDHLLLSGVIAQHRDILEHLAGGDRRSAQRVLRDHLRELTTQFRSGAMRDGSQREPSP